MLGLLIKDFYAMKRQFKMVGLISLVYFVISITTKNIAFIGYLALFANIGLIIAAFGYDEKPNFEKFARVLPVTYKQLVFSRYLETLLINAAITAVLIPASLYIKTAEQEKLEVVSMVTGVVSAGIILVALMLPFIYKMGVEKARIFIFVIVFVPVLGITIIGKMNLGLELNKLMESPLVNFISYHIYIIAPMLAVILLGISYQISQTIMGKKEY